MMSFRITISRKDQVAARFVSWVRRAIQKAFAEEAYTRGLTQSDLARAIGVNRSVISREIRGYKDLSLSRVAELAWALGRRPVFTLEEPLVKQGSNQPAQVTTPMVPRLATIQTQLPAATTSCNNFSAGGY